MRGVLLFGLFGIICNLSVLINAESDWWQTMALYQVYPRSFKDSDGDGIGDIKGIQSKLEHFKDAGIEAFWLSPIFTSPMIDFGYDIANFTEIDPIFGTMSDFENLISEAKRLNIKVILDFVPNHSSTKHEWFKKSVQKEGKYANYYVWHEGSIVNGTRVPPNNWVSVFSGPAWTWVEERQAWYLHQFAVQQPDLNFRDANLVQEMKDAIVFWLDKGVDGFRVDAIPHLFEADGFPNEPLSGDTNDPNNYGYTLKHATKDIEESYDMVSQWRQVLDEYALRTDNVTRIMMMEAYCNVTFTMKYYSYGAHFPFNFGFVSNVNGDSTANDIKVKVLDEWLQNVPEDGTSNWVIGNHDNSRVATRFGSKRVDAMNMISLLLPGVSVTYYGEEIGMEDRWMSWEDTQDPQGCGAGEENYASASRDPVRAPFQWDATAAAGFSSTGKSWLPVHDNYQTLNLAAQKQAEVSHYKVYQALTTLRKEDVVKYGSVDVKVLSGSVLAYTRELIGSKPIAVIANLADEPVDVSLDDFSGLPDTLTVYAASIHSSLTAGTKVSKNSFQISGKAGLVLRSSATTFTSSLVLVCFMILQTYFRH